MDKSVVIATSSIIDGSMSKAVDNGQRLANRRAFLAMHSIRPEQTVLVHLVYEGEDYSRYHTVSSDQAGDGITTPSTFIADAVFTRDENLALLLPIADCIGAVLYDPDNETLGLAHLGRHNLLQDGGRKIVEYMRAEFGTDPGQLKIWLSPAAGHQNYPMHDFNDRSLHEVATEQLVAAGVHFENVSIDSRDTTQDASLFSHSEFLKGNRPTDGRQAVVCMMRP